MRHKEQQQQQKESRRKERGHSATSGLEGSKNGMDSSAKKKNTFSNFLSNTQKLTREDLVDAKANKEY